MHRIRSNLAVNNALLKANKYAAFAPTHFRIYDKSTKEICNRLVVVEPFGWYLWAANGELYILNPESMVQCANNTTPAVRVFRHAFVETCLSLSFDSVVSSYTQSIREPILVPYTVETTSFTIINALNLLLKTWLKFDVVESIDTTPMYVTENAADASTTPENGSVEMTSAAYSMPVQYTTEPLVVHGKNVPVGTAIIDVVNLTKGPHVNGMSRSRRRRRSLNDDGYKTENEENSNSSSDSDDDNDEKDDEIAAQVLGTKISGKSLAQMMNNQNAKTKRETVDMSKKHSATQYSYTDLQRQVARIREILDEQAGKPKMTGPPPSTHWIRKNFTVKLNHTDDIYVNH